jgi:hypothetical protein
MLVVFTVLIFGGAEQHAAMLVDIGIKVFIEIEQVRAGSA